MSCGISACPAKEVPPCPRPAWFKCPAPKCEPMYLAPEGACIQPITKGGRNGGKKKGACGNCGGENRVPPEVKPNAAPDCPMMKLAAPCAAGSNGKQAEGKGSGIVDKCMAGLKGVFGKSQGSPLLISACKKLAGNSENSDHQDLFDPTLLCNKEGYFSPLFSRVDCQCQEPPVEDECEDFEEDDDDDEDCDDDDEEWDEYDYEGELGDEGEGEPEDEEEEAPEACPAQPECPAPCPAPPQCPECIKNTCGECIEEPPECIDPNCKLFLDPKEEDAECEESCKCKEKICDNPCKAFGDDCIAMNNFIIKVQAPRESGKNPNETCEQIIKKLSSNAYPDPDGDRKKKGKKQHPMVVREISVVDPTCECIKPRICNVTEVDVKPPPPPPPCPAPPPPPCPAPSPPPCSEPPPPPPPVRPCPQDCEKKETPPGNGCPPPGQKLCNLPTEPCTCPYEFTPVPPCPCRIKDEPEPPKCEPPKPPPCSPPPRRGDQNDCEVLSEEELLKMPIKDIMCGAPKPLEGSSESYVWLPPPPPKCARCGAEERGKTEDCYLCQITRFARSPCPKPPEEPISIVDEIQELTKPDNSDCEPVYCADGSMKYKGGMCMELCEKFLNQVKKSSPPGGFFARYLGEEGEIERLKAVTGADNFVQACSEMSGCKRPCDLKMEYEGDGIENVKHFLWGVKPPDVHEKFERKCVKKEPEPKKAKQCPTPKKGWFG